MHGVFTACPCPMGYPKRSPMGRYRPKSGWMFTIEYYHVCHKVGSRNQWTKFCYKIKSCLTPCLGSVLYIHTQWVTPSPVQGGAIGQSLKGSVLSNVRKLFTHQALERSEQNFVTKLNHVPHLAWGLYCMSMPNGVPPARFQGAL